MTGRMIVANIKGQSDVKPVKVTLAGSQVVNSIANCFQLKAANTVRNFKKWYSDIDMIGRHYLVYSDALVHIKRQYTICCAAEPKLYKELLKVTESAKADSPVEFD